MPREKKKKKRGKDQYAIKGGKGEKGRKGGPHLAAFLSIFCSSRAQDFDGKEKKGKGENYTGGGRKGLNLNYSTYIHDQILHSCWGGKKKEKKKENLARRRRGKRDRRAGIPTESYRSLLPYD